MPDVAQWVSYGASPRASLGLIAAGRALALLRGRDYVLPQDVLDVAMDVLAHRLVLSYDAIADGVPGGARGAPRAADGAAAAGRAAPAAPAATGRRYAGPRRRSQQQPLVSGTAPRRSRSSGPGARAHGMTTQRTAVGGRSAPDDCSRCAMAARADHWPDARPGRRPRRCCAGWN